MDLLQDILRAQKEAADRNPKFRGSLNGFGGRGADSIWGLMSSEAQTIWTKESWPREILLSDNNGLIAWARKFGKDITNM
ncbi:MAG: hypothetical protein HYS60_01495 [Candidatus Wildermuthbacteria bacterium]|nr:hypothetical protein [Candidatus Wildermuthbacteria bacterium]